MWINIRTGNKKRSFHAIALTPPRQSLLYITTYTHTSVLNEMKLVCLVKYFHSASDWNHWMGKRRKWEKKLWRNSTRDTAGKIRKKLSSGRKKKSIKHWVDCKTYACWPCFYFCVLVSVSDYWRHPWKKGKEKVYLQWCESEFNNETRTTSSHDINNVKTWKKKKKSRGMKNVTSNSLNL